VNRTIGPLGILSPSVVPLGAALVAVAIWQVGGQAPLAALIGLAIYCTAALWRRGALTEDIIRVAYAKPQSNKDG
jgi:hypothetical protein